MCNFLKNYEILRKVLLVFEVKIMKKSGKEMIANLDYNDNEFPVSEKSFNWLR